MGDLASLFGSSPDVVALVDADGNVREVGREDYGIAVGAPFAPQFLDPRAIREAEAEARRTKAGVVVEAAHGTRLLRVSLAPAADDTLACVISDVTERRERLRHREAMLVDTQGVAHLGIWEWDVSQPTAVWSAELYRIYGLTPETYTPTYEAYLERVHPEDRGYVEEATKRVFTKHEPYSHDERIIRADGAIRYLHTWAYPVLDAEGRLERLIGVCQDITDRKTAEISLAKQNERLRQEMAARESVERKLRQAHKLEAIGRLAGGIAHDFNNLLCVILVRSGMVQTGMPGDSPLREHVEEIASVARQSARLTQQLLAFSREQVSQQSVNDLAEIVRELTDMLRRTAREDIEFAIRVDLDEAYVRVDRSQLEQVVMNLVLNARDAMSAGGKLTVEVFDAFRLEHLPDELDAARTYVVLSVSDTGVGMDENVVSRVFDPYFTTKQGGHGLGLSTVYGIATQSGGTVQIASTVGSGSRLRVFFPRADEGPGHPRSSRPVGDLRGSGTILLVEDEATLRRMLGRFLADLGYVVLEAANPQEALELLEGGANPSLLVTDVVMPRTSGVELVKRARDGHPHMRVLYMSGWADASLVAQLQREPHPFLQKPFTPEELALAVRVALR